ncbi:MAG: rhomboid family intramembrane serine protease [Actinomycetota bacterium]|nr:rhomboid family intramembrane serine protease [Actinomycetota bacterium]
MAEAVEKTCYRHPDRVTGLSCSECGRPICTGCMTMAPVGIRCPEHSGKPQGVQRVTRGVRRATFEGTGAKVTKALVAINVAVYVAELATGGGVNGTGSTIYLRGVLFGPLLEQGEWWRLLSAAFLHYGPVHLIMNMVGLYWFGSLLEARIGAGRYLLLYLVSGLAGSAGALLWSNGFLTPTVGASGAIFGILGAGLVLEQQRDYVFGGSALGVILINFVLTFSISSISKGGHIGGLVGGIICALGLTRFGRGHAAYGRPGLLGMGTIALVGVASIAIAYWRVTTYSI